MKQFIKSPTPQKKKMNKTIDSLDDVGSEGNANVIIHYEIMWGMF